jgi:hypothetical protein
MNCKDLYFTQIIYAKRYNLKMSINKTKTMVFKGKYRVRTKIVIEDKILDQVNHFKYLGYDATFLEETDIDAKIKKFQNICGTIGRTLKGKTRKDTQIKLYQVMAVPTLLYGSECWTMRKRHVNTTSSRNAILKICKGMHKTG